MNITLIKINHNYLLSLLHERWLLFGEWIGAKQWKSRWTNIWLRTEGSGESVLFNDTKMIEKKKKKKFLLSSQKLLYVITPLKYIGFLSRFNIKWNIVTQFCINFTHTPNTSFLCNLQHWLQPQIKSHLLMLGFIFMIDCFHFLSLD